MRNAFWLLLVSALATAAMPGAGSAQLLDIRPGERVTVTLDSSPLEITGKFTGQIPDSLYVLVPPSSPHSIPFDDVRAVTRRRVDRLSGAIRGGGIGALVAGGTFGALLALTGGALDCVSCPAYEGFLLGAFFGAPYGAVAGLVIGSVIGVSSSEEIYRRE